MKLSPLRDRCVIRKDKAVDKTEGGIVLPDVCKSPSQMGTVEAIGPGLTMKSGVLAEMIVKVGDRVLFPKYSGTDAKTIGEDLFILPESEILAVLETEETP